MTFIRVFLIAFVLLIKVATPSTVQAKSISDGRAWFDYPNDCSIVVNNFDTIKRKLFANNKRSDVKEFKNKCRFYLAGSTVKSTKDKVLGGLESATDGISNSIKGSSIGSFWEGLTK